MRAEMIKVVDLSARLTILLELRSKRCYKEDLDDRLLYCPSTSRSRQVFNMNNMNDLRELNSRARLYTLPSLIES